MSFFGELAKGGVEGLTGGIGQLAKDIRTAITGEAPIDPNARAELLFKAQALEAAALQTAADFDKAAMTGAQEIAKIEAASPSLFKSGWRPAVGWCCCIGLFYEFLLRPILPWAVGSIIAVSGQPFVPATLPALDLKELMGLLLGMLGLGGMRMVEKMKGVASK